MKAVLTLSGGMDSAVLLYKLMKDGYIVRCLSVDYGQRHRRELQAAANIARFVGVEHKVVDLRSIRELLAGSSQTSDDVEVPHGHYAELSMRKTVVPNRNMILLALAGAWAISTKSNAVAYAAHAGDHAVYPDCREEFVKPLTEALWNADWHQVKIERPFLQMTKADIASLGQQLGVPFHLTYSCYEGEEVHCGRCGTCCERLWALTTAGVADATRYKDTEFWKTAVA